MPPYVVLCVTIDFENIRVVFEIFGVGIKTLHVQFKVFRLIFEYSRIFTCKLYSFVTNDTLYHERMQDLFLMERGGGSFKKKD